MFSAAKYSLGLSRVQLLRPRGRAVARLYAVTCTARSDHGCSLETMRRGSIRQEAGVARCARVLASQHFRMGFLEVPVARPATRDILADVVTRQASAIVGR